MATDKRLQSIVEFPHISWIIGASANGSRANQTLGIVRVPGRGRSPRCHFHLRCPPTHHTSFFGVVERMGKLFFNPPSHSFLVPALFPLVAPLSISGKKEPLCRFIFSSAFAMQCTLCPSGKLWKKRSAAPLTWATFPLFAVLGPFCVAQLVMEVINVGRLRGRPCCSGALTDSA